MNQYQALLTDLTLVTTLLKALFAYGHQGLFDERQLRILAGIIALWLGEFGIRYCHEILGMAPQTTEKGMIEIKSGNAIRPDGRIRESGGGRKASYEKQPDILDKIKSIVDRSTYGNPEGGKLYKNLSLRDIKDELAKDGIDIGKDAIGKCLEKLGYSRQQNQKLLQVGQPHPQRDEIIAYIYQLTAFCEANGIPCISIDAKNKISVGNYKMEGSEYRPTQEPRLVNDHDFVPEKITPYGGYLVNTNSGMVVLNSSSDTAQLAVSSLQVFYEEMVIPNFGYAKEIVVLCDGGGSNGRRVRLFKRELAEMAENLGITIHVCHFPPGESKFNFIEHRMFNHVSRTFAAKPINSIDEAKSYIENTTTREGLTVSCEIDYTEYKTGIKVSKEDLGAIDIENVGPVEGFSYIIYGFKDGYIKDES